MKKIRWKFYSSNEAGDDGRGAPHGDRARKSRVVGDDPAKQPLSGPSISVDISALSVGVKELRGSICKGAKLLRAKNSDMRADALPKGN